MTTNKYVVTTDDQSTTGNAPTATKLATARNINGAAFDGSTDITLEKFCILQGSYTLTSQTAAQGLFGGNGGTNQISSNGALALPLGVNFFECVFGLTGLSATSGSFGFGFGGTATVTQAWAQAAGKGAALTVATANTGWNTAFNTAGLISFSTNSNGSALIRGNLVVTVAGTLIPQISMTTAAAAVVAAGSYFRIQNMGTSSTAVGPWS